MPKVRKAVIAAAGFGTRFLPQTKAMPKEMLPVVDKPVIQYIVEDLVKAGIQDIIIVTGYSKRSIEDHFDHTSMELRTNLKEGGKDDLLKEVRKISQLANFAYIRQKGPYGTGTPIMNASHLIGDEPVLYTFADDLTIGSPNLFEQMIAWHEEFGGSIVPCVRATTDKDYESYGIIAGEAVREDVLRATTIVEKPGRDKAPSDFAGIGGYLLTPDVFEYLEKGSQNLEKGQEFYLTDAVLRPMMEDGKDVYGCLIKSEGRYDTGNPIDYLKTVFDFALQRDDIGPELAEHLRKKLQ